jgi:pimeloyl-ACP methyl ester carboxylesterase
MRAFLIATALAAAGLQPYDPFAEARRVTVNGAPLAYVERGEGGTPLVLVHGSGADLRTWGYQLQHFGGTRRTIAYSRRFHHPNTLPGEADEYSPRQHADDLIALIDTLASGRADVVASSYGALVALMGAGAHPQRIRRLVVVEPVVFSMLSDESAAAEAPAAFERARRQLLGGEPETAMRTFLSVLIAPGAYDLMPESARAMLRDNHRELLAEARAPLPGTSPRYTCDDLDDVTAPTLLVAGDRSAAFLREMTARIAACLPQAEQRTVPGAAHAVHAQQVQGFNTLVDEFLAR